MSFAQDDESTLAITVVCTMATPECDEELRLFLRCLRVVHPHLRVVVGCTTAMTKSGPETDSAFAEFGADERIEWVPCLDAYPPINRSEMEQQRGVWYPSRHADFMMEKSNLMEHAMASHVVARSSGGDLATAVAFLDCDIVLLGELPRIPSGTEVALSAHKLRAGDEALFGRYNGGYVVVTNPSALCEWRRSTKHSRYFDQASLESVASKFSSSLYELPPQHNYGYWRLFQTYRADPLAEARQFSIKPIGTPCEWTLCYEGAPLRSIHTHFLTPGRQRGRDVQVFNALMRRWLQRCIQPRKGSPSSAILTVAANHIYERCLSPHLWPVV